MRNACRILLHDTPRSVATCSALNALGGFFASQTGPMVRAALANVTRTEQRGMAFALFALSDDVGKGAGPIAIAALVGHFGRRRAFAFSVVAWLPCAFLCGAISLTARADEMRARGTPSAEEQAIMPLDE